VREARDSIDGERQVAELQKALKDVSVDWKLNFFSAKRDDDRNVMRVALVSQETRDLVIAFLPIAGNEQMPLMDRADIFRLRGKISKADTLAIEVTDATLEYVSSKKE
jgi:hypothetical protein